MGREKVKEKINHIQIFTPKIFKAFKYLGPIFYLKGWSKLKILGSLNYSKYLKWISNHLTFTTGTVEGSLDLELKHLGMNFGPAI